MKKILRGWRTERDTRAGFVMVVHSDSHGSCGLLFAENCRIWDEKEGAKRRNSFFDDGLVCGGVGGNIIIVRSLSHLRL